MAAVEGEGDQAAARSYSVLMAASEDRLKLRLQDLATHDTIVVRWLARLKQRSPGALSGERMQAARTATSDCFELLQEIDRELPEHKTALPLGKALAAAFVADVAARGDRPRSGYPV